MRALIGGSTPKASAVKEDYCARVAAHAVGDGAFYVLQGIGDAGVLRQGAVGVVFVAGFAVHADVFEDGPEADGVVDLGLFLFR